MSKHKTTTKKTDARITLGSGNNIVTVMPRKSRLAKRVIIRQSRKNGFELVVPQRASMKQALEFLYKKESWVLEQHRLLKSKQTVQFTNGAELPILGNVYKIVHSQNLRGVTRIEGEQILVYGLAEHTPRKIQQFLTKLAKHELLLQAEIEAQKLGVKFARLTVRDTSSRWGSCARSGNISFSWRLVMAPRNVLEYVVAHEISHLLEMNHSKKFWHIVASICPEYKRARQWLQVHGGQLHGDPHAY